MTIKVLDRAFETTISTGAGAITLQGAVAGFQSFGVAGNGQKVLYQINDGDTSGVVQNWEIGIGTITVGSPNTLSRDTVLSSSNNNAAVNFGTGTKNVLGSIAAKALAVRDENLNFVEGFGTGGGTENAQTVTLPVAPLGYSGGMEIMYFATVANTGAMTLNVNGLGVKPAKINGADVPAGLIQAGSFVRGIYRTSTGVFELTSPGFVIAGQTDAEAGTDTVKLMTPVRTKQAIKKLSPVLQYVEAISNVKSSTSTAIPLDDTIPQITEGTEYLTVTITPSVIGSKIVPRIAVPVIGHSTANNWIGAIFRDAVSDALAAGCNVPTNNTYQLQFALEASGVVTTSLDPIVFRFRYGPHLGTNTAYINRGSAAVFFGAASLVKFSATEYAP